MVAPWRLCGQCCCRYGCVPLLVVPIVTLGCCLSLYSSAGCKFVDIDIGFSPTNEGWDASTPYSFGPLFYHNASVIHDSRYREALHTGCVAFSDSFSDNYIDGDRTFKMIQIMTLISCASSALAMFVSWVFIISPIPAGILWPALLLPSVMIAFIAEGSKFLMFDTALCRSSMWYRGSLLVPEMAESCTMGDTAWFSCAAAVLHFWGLVCVCLRAPERRTFHKNLGPMDKNMEVIKEEQEPTTDDLDVGDDDSQDSLQNIEEGDVNSIMMKGGALEKDFDNEDAKAATRCYQFSESVIRSVQQYDATDLPLKFMPIDTSMDCSAGAQCCSPMSEGKPIPSPELVPDIPTRDNAMSPVDCIIEGFDVATDLSQIDVCRTMVYSPTRKALPLENSGAEKSQTVRPAESQALVCDKVSDIVPDTPISERSVGNTR